MMALRLGVAGVAVSLALVAAVPCIADDGWAVAAYALGLLVLVAGGVLVLCGMVEVLS